MANSPSHALGQIIGYTMELAFYKILREFITDDSYYIDKYGERSARENKKKVTWLDDKKNKHDLDFVIEKNGTETHKGIPVAFIESAWRRYTKHSVNKAGEIVNSLIPLRRTYNDHHPFLGAVVSGEWTAPGLVQMSSQGIKVVSIPVPLIINAFRVQNIDVHYVESTDTNHMQNEVDKWHALTEENKQNVIDTLASSSKQYFVDFLDDLKSHLTRRIERIIILPLYGELLHANNLDDAISIISNFEDIDLKEKLSCLRRIEIQMRFSNLTKIEGSFNSKEDAIDWLKLNKNF